MNLEKTLIRMVKFIEVEGDERTKEIERKGKEEEESALGELQLAERGKINNYYRKLEDRMERQKVAEVTQLVNEARGALLGYKASVVMELLEEVHDRILEDIGDRVFYKELLVKMLVQSMCRANERFVGIRVRRQDSALAEEVLDQAEAVYRRISGSDVRFEIDDEVFLSDNEIGGLVLFAKAGTIKVKNTIRSRLDQVGNSVHSFIRQELFGRRHTTLSSQFLTLA